MAPASTIMSSPLTATLPAPDTTPETERPTAPELKTTTELEPSLMLLLSVSPELSAATVAPAPLINWTSPTIVEPVNRFSELPVPPNRDRGPVGQTIIVEAAADHAVIVDDGAAIGHDADAGGRAVCVAPRDGAVVRHHAHADEIDAGAAVAGGCTDPAFPADDGAEVVDRRRIAEDEYAVATAAATAGVAADTTGSATASRDRRGVAIKRAERGGDDARAAATTASAVACAAGGATSADATCAARDIAADVQR
ncbi:hypothetical protein [Bradyrhizobium sp. JR3.5]